MNYGILGELLALVLILLPLNLLGPAGGLEVRKGALFTRDVGWPDGGGTQRPESAWARPPRQGRAGGGGTDPVGWVAGAASAGTGFTSACCWS